MNIASEINKLKKLYSKQLRYKKAFYFKIILSLDFIGKI